METTNVKSELLLLSDLYKSKINYTKIHSLVDPYLFFSETKTRTLYKLVGIFYQSYDVYDQVDFRIFLTNNKDLMEEYLAVGGMGGLDEIMSLGSSSFKQNFEAVRKYSLLREFNRNGFDTDRLMKNERFDQLSARKIYDVMRAMVDNIKTKVDGDMENNIIITEGAVKFVEDRLASPDIGTSFGCKYLDEAFRAFRKGEFVCEGMNSNCGKSRKAVFHIVHMALMENKKVFFMSNEMTVDKIKACVLVSILNHPKFMKMAGLKGISLKENDLMLGIYKDDDGNIIIRDEEEEDIDFIKRVKEASSQFRKIHKMLVWIESQLNITYKYLRAYSDADLEIEIRKEVYGNNCDFVYYDTLKSWRGGDWSAIKETATRLSELAGELQIGVYANVQFTDESLHVPVHELDSTNIASCKHLYHVLDQFIMTKRIEKEEYANYSIINPKTGKRKSLDGINPDLKIYASKIAKSRSSGSHVGKNSVIVYAVDLDKDLWKSLGLLEKGGL